MPFSTDSIIFTAFSLGIISACSLPLGALSTLLWKPSDRSIAVLMSFGSGALLAALTLDLVAGTVAKGDFYPLAAGCITGGLLFIGLNNVVNDFGGFLRKASTTMYHLRKQEYRKFKKIFSMAKRTDVFSGLSDADFKVLAAAIHHQGVKKGASIFTKGDPCDNLYFIDTGNVSLLDPVDKVTAKTLGHTDDLGWLAFLTGTPYRFTARAVEDVSLWVLPKTTFFQLLHDSPTLAHAVQHWLRDASVTHYLNAHHGLSKEAIRDWQDHAIHTIVRRGIFSSAVTIDHKAKTFCKAAKQIKGFNFLAHLPQRELQAIADRLIFKKFAKGETFFHRGEEANYLYIIEQGTVSKLDAVDYSVRSIDISSHYSFGYMAFFTGGHNTMSAVALEATEGWVLRRKDFNDLLTVLPALATEFKKFLQQQQVLLYLKERQGLNTDTATKWVKNALKNISTGKKINPVARIHFDISEHKGAPLGIWLGLMLDGVPEALVIGAGTAHSGLAFSLLAGLFFSNYPEALSSSSGMRQQGMKFSTILLMWTSLMLITGLLSALGSIYFAEVSAAIFAFTEGVAAGAMLTMIAQTMLPEAYIKGGEIVGFSTLLGFLTAIFFKTLE
ncbi:MAG: cyclic nucleotide-binding domain-containing protein [Methyloprofundus sp.]|nr:cyclic nucleotide-binding domain-containing protein [Methyloprofundus sp.]